MKWLVILLLIGASIFCLGQRIPPPPQSKLNSLNNPSQQQNVSGGTSGLSLQAIQQQQKNEELANIKDENIKKVLQELSTLQTPSQLSETMARVAELTGPLFIKDFDARKNQILTQSRDSKVFPQRLLSAITDIQGEEIKALVLQRKLELLHASDFAFLPLAIQYGFQEEVLANLSGTKMSSVVKVNPGDTVIAYKISSVLMDQPEKQIEFLQSLGPKLLPQVQRIIMSRLLEWWGDPHNWRDRELNLLTSAGTPLLAYLPQSQLQSLDDELADRFVTILGQTQDIARGWWRKPMSLKKAWFDVAKGARYFGAVHEWSFRRMQKLSFLLEGASPEDLQLIPGVPEIKNLVISNHYTELQARVVFDAFYPTPPLSQEDLQEFQFHVLDLTPVQLQRFDFADSFGTLDEMMSILDRQRDPSYPTVLQISYFMWPMVNSSNSVMAIAPPSTWQKRELAQIGKLFYLLPKSVLSQIRQGIINWDSNTLAAIRSNHLTQFQIWKLTSDILLTVDERFKPDYIFMIPSPYQKGIPSHNISQALLGSTTVRPEILRALIEEVPGMLVSQKAVILQRIIRRIGESIIIRTIISAKNPSEMFKLISPKILSKNMAAIIKTIMEMPETGRFGITSIHTKLLPPTLLSLWLKWVRENGQVARWTAEDLLGRSSLGATHELNLAILGLTCRDIEIIDSWDILSVIMHYRHELYALRRFKPSLKFNVNLRSCALHAVLEYLQQKRFLSGNQTDEHILAGITVGETEAIGGEILSLIPTTALEQLDMDSRQNIIREIGQLQMQELFSLSNLKNLQWYGRTLFRDIAISSAHGPDISSQRKKRQTESMDEGAGLTPEETSSFPNTTNPNDAIPASNTTGFTVDSRSNNDTGTERTAVPSDLNSGSSNGSTPTHGPLPKHGIDIESLNSMGNLLCYADNVFDAQWPRSLLKDVLEAKTSVGEKTCCLTKVSRDRWFNALKAVYGADTSSWNEFDITAIGDLLIVLPDKDLQKISKDALGKAITPLMRQSAWANRISIPGEIKKIQYITACSEALGTEGQEFMMIYKNLMKRLFEASQWMVNTVKTTQELIRDGVGRTGRIPRWAEHTLVKRQVPLSFSGGQLSYGSSPVTGAATPVYYQATTPGYAVQPQGNVGFVTYAPQYAAPMVPTYNAQQQVYTTPMYNVQSGSPIFVSQPMGQMVPAQPGSPMMTSQQVVPAFGTMAGTQPGASGSGVDASGAISASGAGSVVGDGFSNNAASGAVAGGIGGGSFSSAGSLAQTNANNANAFGQGGSFTQGTDLTQTAGGSFSQANSNANTFASRSTTNNQPNINPQQPPQFENVLGQNQAPPLATQAPAGMPSGTLQGQSGNLQAQPQMQTGTPPGQPQGGNLQGPQQTTGGSPNVQPQPQSQGLAPPGQPQPGSTPPGQSQPQGAIPPGQPQSQGANPPGQFQQQGGNPQGQPQSPGNQQGPPGMQAGTTGSPDQQFSGAGTNVMQPPIAASNIPLGPGRTPDQRTRSLNFGVLQDDTHNSEISCHGIKASGSAAIGLRIDDLDKLSQADLFDCVEALGRIEWDEDIKGQIMTLLKDKLEFNKDSINALTLIELGDLVTAFSAKDDGTTANTSSANATIHSDISMIDLTLPNSLDMLSILGTQITNPALLKSLAEKFNQDNKIFPGFSEGIARPENLRIVVMSLGNIICGLNDKIVNSIFETDASLFLDTSTVLGKLEGCGDEVLTTLAAHAVRPSNYGPPRLWSQEDVETIGVVFAGLKPDAISTIPADAMQGLTPLAVKSLPASSVLAFTPAQLSRISYSAARAFTPAQSNNFSPANAEAIQSVLEIKSDLFTVPSVDPPTTTTEAPPQDLETRDLEGDDEEGLQGRAKESPTQATTTTPPPVTTTETTPETTTPPPTTEAPTSSSSSSKVRSVWHNNYFVKYLVMIIPVMQVLNI